MHFLVGKLRNGFGPIGQDDISSMKKKMQRKRSNKKWNLGINSTFYIHVHLVPEDNSRNLSCATIPDQLLLLKMQIYTSVIIWTVCYRWHGLNSIISPPVARGVKVMLCASSSFKTPSQMEVIPRDTQQKSRLKHWAFRSSRNQIWRPSVSELTLTKGADSQRYTVSSWQAGNFCKVFAIPPISL